MAGYYFGGKGEESMSNMRPLFPDKRYNTFVDAFFGMGNVSRLSACENRNVKIVAYEKERSLYVLHEVIKEYELFKQLTSRIPEVEDTKDYYEKCKNIIDTYNAYEKDYNKVDVALAVLVNIRFSRDYKRNSWRDNKSYEGRNFSKMEVAQKKTELKAIVDNFRCFTASNLLELHYKWAKVNLINDDCMNHLDEHISDRTLYFIDPPYLPEKRGFKMKENKRPKNRGYIEDLSVEDHEMLIDKVIQLSKAGAMCMVCSLFELDENNNLVGVADDPYTRLMANGFRMVVVQKKYSTMATHDVRNKNGERVKMKKKPKVEVVYINYTNILGVWSNYKYMDYKDIVK